MRYTLEQCRSFQLAAVICSLDFTFKFNLYKKPQLLMMAADGRLLIRANGVIHCLMRFVPVFNKNVHFALSSSKNFINWIFDQTLQGYARVQVGTSFHVFDLTYTDDMMLLSHSYRGVNDLRKELTITPTCMFTYRKPPLIRCARVPLPEM